MHIEEAQPLEPDALYDESCNPVAGALTVNGNTVLGSTGGSQTLTVNGVTSFSAAVTASSAVTVSGTFTASGNTVLGSSSGSQTVTINSPATLNAAVTATAPVTAASVTVTGALTATGNTVIGSSSGSSSLTVNAPAVFNAPVEVQDELSMPQGSLLNVSGDAILGGGSSDYVTINGVTTFTSAVAFEGSVTFSNETGVTASSDTVLGTTSEDVLLVNAAATFTGGLQVDDDLSIDSLLSVAGDTVLGNSSSDYLIVHATATFTGPVDVYGRSNVPANSSVIEFQRRLGTSAVTTGTVLGAVMFTGWDSATDAPGAEIRSVFTVSLTADTSAGCAIYAKLCIMFASDALLASYLTPNAHHLICFHCCLWLPDIRIAASHHTQCLPFV